MESEREELMKKRVVILWKQWVLAFVCLVLACFHILCFVYATRIAYLKAKAIVELEESKKPLFPFKELLLLCMVGPSMVFPLILAHGLMQFMLNYKAVKQNMNIQGISKEFAGLPCDGHRIRIPYINESEFLGTDLYKEAARDYTKRTFYCFAFVYAVAIVLQVGFNIFEALELFSVALIMIFSGTFASFFGKSSLVNIKIALHIGEDEQGMV